MISGYAGRASVWPGQELVLHIACGPGRFRVAFYRWLGRLVPMFVTRWLSGEHAQPRSADADWDWPPYRFPLARDWPSGVYLAHLELPGSGPPHLAMQDASVLFIVRGRSSALLYKIPLATYNAYNFSGGGCFYANPPRSISPPGARLSLRRPGIGIGGPTFGAPDYYDPSSPRQTFAHWDARFIRWLVREGYAPDFCTDLDLHDDPALCRDHRLLLSVGHDEYWSEPMRDCVEAHLDAGGHAAFFSANLCWWRIHLVDHGAAMVCHQGGPQGAHDRWRDRPEDGLAGVSYRHGGGWWDGPRSSKGFSVIEAGHWVFAGTGLRQGDVFGNATWPPLVGYECDGAPLAAPLSPAQLARGEVQLSSMAVRCGTRLGFRPLAVSLLDERWQERPARELHDDLHAATMGICEGPGTVFTAATTDWAQVLDSGQDARVQAITHNVLLHLLAAAPGIARKEMQCN
jgi:hypothetical protein